MSRHLRCALAYLVLSFLSVSMAAQAPELYWGLEIAPGVANGYSNMVWLDLDGVPGPPPVPASPPIPTPYGAWTAEGGPWWMDAVQVQGQPVFLLVLTAGYAGELRAFRTNGGVFTLCGDYPLPNTGGENGGVRVSPSGSFAVVTVGSSPSGFGDNLLLKFPLNLATPHNVSGTCLLAGAPTKIQVPTNPALRNVDFNPMTPAEVVISGYSNIVTFVDPILGKWICDATLPPSVTRLEARYNPDGTEVWASSYNGQQIAVIKPPPDCSVMQYISAGFLSNDGLHGGSFHPDPSVGAYYVTSYPGDRVFALDTTKKSISSMMQLPAGTASMTAVTRGPTTYLETVIYGCCPQFGHTDTYDVTNSVKALDPFDYPMGAHQSSVYMRRVATLRNVKP